MTVAQAAFLQVSNTDPVITAGQPLYLQLDILDIFGNPAECTLPMHAQIRGGPMLTQLAPDKATQVLQARSPMGTQAAASPHVFVFAGEVLKAGPVMVEVLLGGACLLHWPRSLLVVAGRPCADRCNVRGLCKVRWLQGHSGNACLQV